jgi:ankyrin repeat protein
MSKWKRLYNAVCDGEIDKVKQLLAEGAKVDYIDKFGRTTCHMAAILGRTAIMELLITHGADFNNDKDDGWTPCHCAAYNGRLDTLKVLISHNVVFDTRSKAGMTPRGTIVWEGSLTAKYLDYVTNLRSVACYLIRVCRRTPLNQVPILDNKGVLCEGVTPLPKEDMGDLGIFPKEIIAMIARWVWASRRNLEISEK